MNVRAVRRAINNLEKKGILISKLYGCYGRSRTKWYTIDYDIFNSVMADGQKDLPKKTNFESSTVQNDQFEVSKLDSSMCPKWTVPYNNIYNIDTDNKETNKNKKEEIGIGNFCEQKSDSHFDASHHDGYDSVQSFCAQFMDVARMRLGNDLKTINKLLDVVLYYFETYDRVFHRDHPYLSRKGMLIVIDALLYGTESEAVEGMQDYEAEWYQPIIDKHFQTKYRDGCNYSIVHFVSDKIRDNRAYETNMV